MSESSSQFGAAPSAIGYLYQCRLALLLLLAKPVHSDIVVSLEVLDDVAFEEAGTPIELIQVKHSIKSVCDLSDVSPRLWKTLRIWSEQVKNNEVDLNRTALNLLTTGIALPETAAFYLQDQNRNELKAEELILRAAAKSRNQENAAGIAAFNALSAEQRRELLARIHILPQTPNIVELETQLLAEFQNAATSNAVRSFVGLIEGWWLSRVIKQLMGVGQPISRIDLQLTIDDVREQLKRDNLPALDVQIENPPDESVSKMNEVYVEQLRLINLGLPVIRSAVSDYLKSSAARSQWIREQLISTRELGTYFDELISEWSSRFHFQRGKLTVGCDDGTKIRCGQQVFENVQHTLTIPLRNRSEGYLMRGAYHELADDLKVGWHPEYEVALQRKGGKKS
jgi:C-terminal domain 7 of the ABC-three component (ABC-3C) systems